jgi:hypothetical protein
MESFARLIAFPSWPGHHFEKWNCAEILNALQLAEGDFAVRGSGPQSQMSDGVYSRVDGAIAILCHEDGDPR